MSGPHGQPGGLPTGSPAAKPMVAPPGATFLAAWACGIRAGEDHGMPRLTRATTSGAPVAGLLQA